MKGEVLKDQSADVVLLDKPRAESAFRLGERQRVAETRQILVIPWTVAARYSSLMTTPHRLFVFPRLSRFGIHGMKLEDG